jgi:hypothetical protein
MSDETRRIVSPRKARSSLAATVAGLILFAPFKADASANTTRFWAIADVPYSDLDKTRLGIEMKSLGSDADFLIHLGDIKVRGSPCSQKMLTSIDEKMKLCPVPVFMLVGDNEFNDCQDIQPKAALAMWRNTFARYDVKHWSHKFTVSNMPRRSESFAFVHKRTLFIGINFVGGKVHDENEWKHRHSTQLNWVKRLMLGKARNNLIHSVVLFGQADPGPNHGDFINPFVVFLRKEFSRDIPVLYLCGDAHKWAYNPGYHNVSNWLRVRLTRGLVEPTVRITVDPDGRGRDPTKAFKVERFL